MAYYSNMGEANPFVGLPGAAGLPAAMVGVPQAAAGMGAAALPAAMVRSPTPAISPGGGVVNQPMMPPTMGGGVAIPQRPTTLPSPAMPNRFNTGASPAGPEAQPVAQPATMAQGDVTSQLMARLGQLQRQGAAAQFFPQGFQPFGTASTGTESGTGPAARGGDASVAGPNTGGVGMAASDAVTGGFGTMGGFASSNPGISMGGTMGMESGFNASPDATGINVGPNSALGQSQAEAIDSSSAVTGALSGVQSVNVGTTPNGEVVSVNPSTGVVSVGGEAVGVVGGGGGATGGGGMGSEGGGIGLGGVADGSSNAGIGGPGGTGAVGGAGDAGQGTGGPGEGDQYGGHFTVGGIPIPGRPDNMNVNLRATPGEHVTVTPPGVPPGQILQRPEQPTQWRMGGPPQLPPGIARMGGAPPGLGGGGMPGANPFMGLPGRR